jgi:hypothetical protein
MGEHHDKHIAQEIQDHPAMVAHSLGTEPLEVRKRTNLTVSTHKVIV